MYASTFSSRNPKGARRQRPRLRVLVRSSILVQDGAGLQLLLNAKGAKSSAILMACGLA